MGRIARYLLMIVVLLGSAPPLWAQQAPVERLRQSLGVLEAWLQGSPRGPAWREYLKLDQLHQQLASPQPQLTQVAEVLAQFRSGAEGLNEPQFVAVRDSLAAWLRELPVNRDELPRVAEEAQDLFRPINEAQVRQARAELQTAIGQLEQFLRQGGAPKETAWKEYLQWQAVQEELQKDQPDLTRLNEALVQFYANYTGLELPVFQRARSALRHYMNRVYFAGQEDLPQTYAQQLTQLAQQLATYGQQPTTEQAEAIGNTIGWLERAEQAEHLVEAVRRHFQRPNFRARLSNRLINAGFRDTVDQVSPIQDVILGTYVTGTAHTQGTLDIALVPSAAMAMFDIQLTATAFSDSVGFNGPVTIYSHGQTALRAAKRLGITPQGVFAGAADARAQTDTTINDIAARHHLVRRIAWRRAMSTQPLAEQIASERAAQRAEREMDAETAGRLQELNAKFSEKFRLPLVRLDAFPQVLNFSSTDEHLLVSAVQAGRFQLAAPNEAPQLPGDYDLAVRMHESIVRNSSEPLLGGRTYTNADFAQLVQEWTGEVPEQLRTGPDQESWSITFSAQNPLAARFDEGRVTLFVRGRRFTRAEDVIRNTIEISAVYQVERTESGVRLTRQGDVQVEYVGLRRLGTRQVALKTFLQRKFEGLFQDQIVTQGFQLPGRWERAGILELQDFQVGNGWVAAGWRARGLSTETVGTR